MPTVHDIHSFYEANLPGYQRRHLPQCNRFFLELMGKPCKKPQNEVLIFWNDFRQFVVFDWLGESEISTHKIISNTQKKKKKHIYGKCECGGLMIKRQNRSDKSYFLGCDNWPKCSKTKPLLN